MGHQMFLSDTGYTCAWQIYTGSQSQTATTADSERQSEADHPARVPLPGQVVLELLNGLDNRGHCIFADNWYTSPALVNKLTQRGFGFCGTVRYTTQGVSNLLTQKSFPWLKDRILAFMTSPDNCVLPGRTRSVWHSCQTMGTVVLQVSKFVVRRVPQVTVTLANPMVSLSTTSTWEELILQDSNACTMHMHTDRSSGGKGYFWPF